MSAKLLAINGVSNQPFWQLPEGLVGAISACLPGWTIEVARSSHEIGPAVRRSDVAVGWPFPLVLARGATRLRRVHFFTAGVPESWEALAAGESSVRVTSARGANARSVAEHGAFLALAAIRGLRPASLDSWDPEGFGVARRADTMCAIIIGFGAIGRHLAHLVAPLFARLRVVSRSRPEDVPPGVEVEDGARVMEVVASADVVFVAVPLTAETRALFGPSFFAALKSGALLVNVARGELLDEDLVLAFLSRSPTSVYATDVASPEPYPSSGKLRGSARVIMTPHVGARREDAWSSIQASTLEVLQEERGRR